MYISFPQGLGTETPTMVGVHDVEPQRLLLITY